MPSPSGPRCARAAPMFSMRLRSIWPRLPSLNAPANPHTDRSRLPIDREGLGGGLEALGGEADVFDQALDHPRIGTLFENLERLAALHLSFTDVLRHLGRVQMSA